MTTPSFEQFKATQLAQGFDEVLERPWAPNTVVGTHSHPFSVSALVVQGELWRLCPAVHSRHYVPRRTMSRGRRSE